jgi:hypothetical protein
MSGAPHFTLRSSLFDMTISTWTHAEASADHKLTCACGASNRLIY